MVKDECSWVTHEGAWRTQPQDGYVTQALLQWFAVSSSFMVSKKAQTLRLNHT